MQDGTLICYACLPSFKMQVIYASSTYYASYAYMQAQHVMQVMCVYASSTCYARYVYDNMQVHMQ